MAFTPVSASDPVAPLENILNTRFTELDNSITAVSGTRQIQTYKWANQAARLAQAGMTEGDVGDQADTDRRYRYSGTAWMDITSGLFPVTATSVAGTGVTLGQSGRVSFTGATSVSVNGCFTAAFDNYKIVFSLSSKTAVVDTTFRLRAAGVDASGANYNYVRGLDTGTSRVVASNATATSSVLDFGTSVDNDLTLYAPFLTQASRFINLSAGPGGVATIGCYHTLSSSYDGFTIAMPSGQVTGILRIYGYNNN